MGAQFDDVRRHLYVEQVLSVLGIMPISIGAPRAAFGDTYAWRLADRRPSASLVKSCHREPDQGGRAHGGQSKNALMLPNVAYSRRLDLIGALDPKPPDG
jgi:hypothetical protein